MPPVPEVLKPVVADLRERRVRVVTLHDLAAYGSCMDARDVADTLTAACELWRTSVDGAWQVAWYSSTGDTTDFTALAAYLALRPDFAGAVAAKSVAQAHQWLYRPTRPTIGVPHGVAIPTELDCYSVARWTQRAGVHHVGRVPVWKPATVVAFAAATPTEMVWGDVAEWLDLLCGRVAEEELCIELADRPRRAWMAAAYILWRGEQAELAQAIKHRAPDGSGTHDYGPPRQSRRFTPQLHPEFELIDHVICAHWSEFPARLRAMNAVSRREHGDSEARSTLRVDHA